MSVKYVVVHRNDTNNVGDLASNPLQYFLQPDQYRVVDITHSHVEQYPSGVPLIAGGGGLLANDFFGDNLRACLNNPDVNRAMQHWTDAWQHVSHANAEARDTFMQKLQPLVHEYLNTLDNSVGKRILWGAGHNEDTIKRIKEISFPGWLNFFDLVGIRDYKQAYKWVPCASAMHPALTKKYPIRNKVVWFEHKKQLIKATNFGTDSIPRYINSGSNIEQTIELLGSAETIITNSFHGAYWGALLGRKVIVVDAWSSKFFTMKHTPIILKKGEDWKDQIDNAQIYPNALEECRQVTTAYWHEVQQL
jgi:hypothetical protein|tara:strand:+ start:931 stop:1848 length:918 start_codon:yes stop_codon:yes gene_type:complete